MRVMARMAAVVAAAGMLLVPGTPAVAHDHRPPDSFLLTMGKVQEGILGTYCWIRSSGPGFVMECADSIYSWPGGMTTKTRDVTVAFRKQEPPQDLDIIGWRRVNASDYPKGEAVAFRYTLTPALRGGEVEWHATFRLPGKPGHWYIYSAARWPDADGGGMQDASWTYHVNRKPA